MESKSSTPAVLFDLDGTLFDHYHSLRSAIAAIRQIYTDIGSYDLKELVSQYNASLQSTYDEYLQKKITYEEADSKKVRLFFQKLGLASPDDEAVAKFRDVYKPAYRNNRRATPESIEMLVRLREHGFRLAIVTNGQAIDQLEKAKAIGVHHLVDYMMTSEEAGFFKPDKRIFHLAINTLGSSVKDSYMVGDSVDSDIKGAIDGDMSPILYSPMSKDDALSILGETVPVISSMSQLTKHLGVCTPIFRLQFSSGPSRFAVKGIGMDVVTEPRHCLHLMRDCVHSLAQHMSHAFQSISETRYIAAIAQLAAMVRLIAAAATPLDETRIRISLPSHEENETCNSGLKYEVQERPCSMRIEFNEVDFSSGLMPVSQLQHVIEQLQSQFDNLTRDHPRAALRNLRSAMLTLAERAGVGDSIVVEGEGI